jgi:hypothetical protein
LNGKYYVNVATYSHVLSETRFSRTGHRLDYRGKHPTMDLQVHILQTVFKRTRQVDITLCLDVTLRCIGHDTHVGPSFNIGEACLLERYVCLRVQLGRSLSRAYHVSVYGNA